MSVSTSPPAPPQKKRGLGCCGCGCIILALLAVLFLALVAGTSYVSYRGVLKITSSTPADIPTFDGGDDVYNTAQQKVSGFFHDVQNHLPASVQLSADEINTLIARDPDFAKTKIRLFVSLESDQARLETSVPTGILTEGLIKDRYLNCDISFGVDFDSDTKNLNFDLKSLKVGQVDVPKENLAMMQSELNPAINRLLQSDPACKNALANLTSIRIENSELIMESK